MGSHPEISCTNLASTFTSVSVSSQPSYRSRERQRGVFEPRVIEAVSLAFRVVQCSRALTSAHELWLVHDIAAAGLHAVVGTDATKIE
eukprot:3836867-Amphidinium_carterae.1